MTPATITPDAFNIPDRFRKDQYSFYFMRSGTLHCVTVCQIVRLSASQHIVSFPEYKTGAQIRLTYIFPIRIKPRLIISLLLYPDRMH